MYNSSLFFKLACHFYHNRSIWDTDIFGYINVI